MHTTFTFKPSQFVRQSLREVVREWGLLHEYPSIPDITLTQGHALIEISRSCLTIAQLAELLILDQSSVSRLVSRLKRRDLVTISSGKNDKRKKYLSLTRKGSDVLNRLDTDSELKVSGALSLLTADEQKCVEEGLKIYAKALKRSREQLEFNIRPIKKSDNHAMAIIIRSVMTEFGGDRPGTSIHDKEVDEMYQSYSQAGASYYVVEQKGEIVGGAGIANLSGGPAGYCELRKMYFLPRIRGKGLGERLLKLCLEKAALMSYKYCYLETFSRMLQAQALYHKVGFVLRSSPLGNTGHCACDKWYEIELGNNAECPTLTEFGSSSN